MAQEQCDFPDIPPFPSDIPTAPLLSISLAKLLRRDEHEEQRLWDASRQLGFFYLDLRPDEGGTSNNAGQTNDVPALQHLADNLFHVEDQFFSLPLAEKQSYDFAEQGSYYGYKGYGSGVVDAKGTRDRNEFYNISKDDILGLSEPLPGPGILSSGHKNRDVVQSFIMRSHRVVSMILDILSSRLGMKSDCLTNLHHIAQPSGDQVRFVKAPPQPVTDSAVALGAHTDFGSITVLFNRLGGLQVLLPADVSPVEPTPTNGTSNHPALFTGSTEAGERWAYVRPLPHHCIINLGDALVKFSAGILRSNTHRVVPPPGAQSTETRYSLVYFSRPEDKVLLRALAEESEMIRSEVEKRRVNGEQNDDEEVVDAKSWVLRRALGRRGARGLRFEDSGGTEGPRVIVKA